MSQPQKCSRCGAMHRRMERCAQRQDSLASQLRDLHALAVTHGMYDAADFLDGVLKDAELRKRQLEAIRGDG